MTEAIIDSEVAATLLGVSKNNLRQLVHRKDLMPLGRYKRRSRFLLSDVLALKTCRDTKTSRISMCYTSNQ